MCVVQTQATATLTGKSLHMVLSTTAQFGRKSIATALSNATTIGFLELIYWIGLIALVFTGPLSIYVGRAASFMVIGTLVGGTIIGFRSSWRGTIAIPQDVPAAILAVIASRVSATSSAETQPSALFATLVATIAIASITMGLTLYLLGTFRLGNLVRFLPFPVIGGFLGGTGWLLLSGGVASALPPNSTNSLFEPQSIVYWLPTLALALLIYYASARIKNSLVAPTLLITAIGLFFAITAALGYSVTELTQAGWFFGALPNGGRPQLLTAAELASIDWTTIGRQAGSIIVLAAASAIAMLLNTSGLELSLKTDLDPNEDLRVTGIANIVTGLVGGWPIYVTPALSQFNAKDGKQHPLTAPLLGIIAGFIFWNASVLLAYLPRFVAGAVIVYIGIEFLVEWVILPAKRLPRLEYLMLLLVIGVIAIFGLLEGVAVGLVMAIILFVISYAQVDVLRHQFTATHQPSRVTRPTKHRAHLRRVGERTQIFQLQGYVFFGTANHLYDQVQQTIANTATDYLLLDFTRISGVDSTALLGFTKMQQLLDRLGVTFLLAGLSAETRSQLDHQFLRTSSTNLHLFETLDQALEWLEDRQLVAAGYDPSAAIPSLTHQLHTILPCATNIPQLLDLLEMQRLQAGDYLMRQGDPASDMFFIKEGTITAQLEQADQPPMRLETMGPGRTVGELGFYLGQPRTAAVVSDGESVVYRLTKQRLATIEKEHPNVASTLHQLIVHLLSDRVTHLIGVVSALQQ